MTKISLISLGCPKNLVDSETILNIVNKNGYQILSDVDKSDVAIVNTCSFIKSAKEESIEVVFDLVRLKEEGAIKSIIVAGCLPQRYQKELEKQIPEVDAWIGISDFAHLPHIIERINSGHKVSKVGMPNRLYPLEENKIHLTPPHYAYIKIAEGCDNRCHYCIIPRIRGSYRSRPMEAIMKEIEQLSKSRELKEINLISQDTTNYGIDIYGGRSLAKLVEKICRLRKIPWLRILYTHPAHFDDELIELIRNEPSICKYIDLPLQHINDRILKMMGRKITKKDIISLLEKLRSQIPEIAIRTSFIVGFPGETEDEFKELYAFIKKTKFERLGLFTYSPEEGTKAFDFSNQIPEKLKEERFQQIMELQQEVAKEVNSKFLGKILDVLIDEESDNDKNIYLGRTPYDGPEVDGLVYVTSKKAKPGDILKVKITDTYEYDLVGNELT